MTWLADRLRAGLRRRRGAFVLLATLAALVAAIAAATPILTLAVQQSALSHALTSATAAQRSVISNASSDDRVSSLASRASAAKATAALGGSSDWEAARTIREQNDQPLAWTVPPAVGGPLRLRLADIPDCASLHLISGRCPRAEGEAALTDTTFRQQGVRLGQQVTVKSTFRTVTVTIVGAYDPSTPAGAQAAHPGLLSDESYTGLDSDLLLSDAGFTALSLPTTSFSSRALRTHVALGDLAGLREDIARARAVPLTVAGATAGTNVVTTLDALLDRIDEQRTVVAAILDVVAVGATGLALLAFAAVVQRLGRVRAAEWALPRLRGIRRGRRIGARLVEPLLALVVGSVLGSGIAIAAAAALVDPDTRRSLSAVLPVALAVAAAAALCGAIVLIVVSAAADRRALDDQLHRATEPRELTRGALVGEAVVVVAALAAIAALVVAPGSSIDGAGLLAPVLIALAAGFLALQLALVLVRRRTRRTPGSLVGLIVWRRSGRSPSLLTSSVLVAGAVSLGTFVVMTSATAGSLADATAAASAAAPTVLHVRTPDDLPLLDAVQKADPGGSRAMAAEEVLGREGIFRVLAVDTARLEAVSTWRASWAGMDAATLRRRMAPPVEPSLTIRGSRLRVDMGDIAVGPVDQGDEHFELQVSVQSQHGLAVVPLGTFEPTGGRTFSAAIPCADGCTFVSFSVRCVDSYKSPWSLHLLVARMSTDQQPAGRFSATLRSGSWIADNGYVLDPSLPVTSTVRATSSGLSLDLDDSVGGDQPAVRVRDTVEPLPVLLGQTTTAEQFPGARGTIVGNGLDGSPVLMRPIGRASALPRLLGDGVLVDLRRLLPQIDSSSTRPDEQVWVAGDPAAVSRRLRAQGVTILSTERLATAERSQAAEAGPLSARFALISAAAALAVVLLALLGARLLAAPARRRQWRSFAAAGIPEARLRRLVAIEFLTPAVAAVLLGTLTGTVAFVLALPHLPLADGAPGAPPAGIPTPWLYAAASPLVAIAALALMTLVVVRAETRSAPEEAA